MTYQRGDIVIIWERWRGWRWVWDKVRERDWWAVFHEVVWANLVRLVSGPVHVAMLASDGAQLPGCEIWDSDEEGVHRSPMSWWPDEVAVYHARNFTPQDIEQIALVWQSWIDRGVKYGYVRNAAHFCDYVVEWVVWLLTFAWLLGFRPRVVLFRWLVRGGETWGRECSNAVLAAIYEGTGKDFGYRWADPGDMWRFCRSGLHYREVLARTADWRGP